MNRDTTIDPDLEVTRSMTTRKEDAASIIGDELADELDEKAKLVGKSEALIVKSDDEEAIVVEEAKTKKKDEKEVSDNEDEEDMEEEGCGDKKKKMKSEAIDLSPIIEYLDSAIGEIKASYDRPTKPAHVLDEAFETFKAQYDEVYKSDAPSGDKLQMIQEPFNQLGSYLVSTLKATAQPEEVAKSDNAGVDMVKAFSEALQPLAQKLDLLIQQNKPVTNPVSSPQRRSFNPADIQRSNLDYSNKPKSIQQLAEQSVGLTR